MICRTAVLCTILNTFRKLKNIYPVFIKERNCQKGKPPQKCIFNFVEAGFKTSLKVYTYRRKYKNKTPKSRPTVIIGPNVSRDLTFY